MKAVVYFFMRDNIDTCLQCYKPLGRQLATNLRIGADVFRCIKEYYTHTKRKQAMCNIFIFSFITNFQEGAYHNVIHMMLQHVPPAVDTSSILGIQAKPSEIHSRTGVNELGTSSEQEENPNIFAPSGTWAFTVFFFYFGF